MGVEFNGLRPRGFEANLVAGLAIVFFGLGFTPAAPFIGWGIVAAGALFCLGRFVILPVIYNWQLDYDINRPLTEDELAVANSDEDPTTDTRIASR